MECVEFITTGTSKVQLCGGWVGGWCGVCVCVEVVESCVFMYLVVDSHPKLQRMLLDHLPHLQQ